MFSDNRESNPLYKIFSEQGEEIRFNIGQLMCQEEFLPGKIFLIKKGEARRLIIHNNKLTTLNFILPGEFIGIASILKGIPCEEIRAKEDLVAWSISDNKFKELYKNDKNISDYCDNQLWEAEIVFYVKKLFSDNSSKYKISIQDYFKIIKKQAKIVAPNESDINIALANKNKIFVCSHQKNCSFERELKDAKELRSISTLETHFQLRLISFPENIIPSNNKLVEIKNNEIIKENDLENIPLGPSAPQISSLIKNKIPKDLLKKGEGKIFGTLACFQMLSTLMGFPFRYDSIEKFLKECVKDNRSICLKVCAQIASNHGLEAYISLIKADTFLRIKTPSLIKWKDSFAIVIQSNQNGITIVSPSEGYQSINSNQVNEFFPENVEILLLEKSYLTPKKLFRLNWFLPSLNRYKGVLIQVLLAGVIVQLLSLTNPIIVQVIIDKVINQRSLDTLQILGIALIFITVIEGFLVSLKTFLLSETTNRIDQKLGAVVIDHLLHLPLNYFERRPTGELSSRINELEKIRSFLTSQAFTSILDAIFSIIYIIVMLLYSISLTLISLLVLPVQIGITLIGIPLFQKQFRNVAEANAKTQSHLVEVLNGIETIKSQGVEIKSRWKWQELYSKYINYSFERTISGTVLNQISLVLQKTSQLLVLWIGASMVLKGEITLGQLIAFRIISGYVTQPLLRLSSIWQRFQELKVSFERLADVIDTPQESNEDEKNKIIMPPIKGKVTFEKIDFSFHKGSKSILQNINFSVPHNQFVGIVGQSGSGKSTLMKLLPRLYLPKKGRIFIDELDIAKIELNSLRKQIGIVPQEPLLFTGTIKENISLSTPGANDDEIVKAAKLANAHEFIMEMSDGYSSIVNERGNSLSGGQRQRITIARTLLAKPKLLILDEATSSLDHSSERKVFDNLLNKLNCTVFFITHRLSTIKQANIILFMHDGRIDEIGSHKELMEKKGRYFALYRQQAEI